MNVQALEELRTQIDKLEKIFVHGESGFVDYAKLILGMRRILGEINSMRRLERLSELGYADAAQFAETTAAVAQARAAAFEEAAQMCERYPYHTAALIAEMIRAREI